MNLIPEVLFGLVVWIVSIPALVQTLALLQPRKWREERIVVRGLVLFLFSALIYGYEFALGIQMWRQPANKGALIGLLFVLIGAYAVGLGRAWELLGAPRTGFIAGAGDLISSVRRGPAAGSKTKP